MGRSGRTYRVRHRQNKKSVSCSHETWIVSLLRWMKNCRFKTDLNPANFLSTGRGLQTKARIFPGETIISLPSDLMITTKTVLDSEIGVNVKRWSPKLSPQQCISIFLIWEKQKGHSSSWNPYIDSLPEYFNTPAYFTTKEITFLPKSFKSKAILECQKIRQRFLEVEIYAKHHWNEFYNLCNWDVFRWAWFVINTRSVYCWRKKSVYLSDDEEDNLALAPFLDLLNHSPDAKITAGYDETTNCYKIVTHDVYKPYDQVFISYGSHGNRHLVLEYGFCVKNNSQDEVMFDYDDVIEACKYFECILMEEKIELLRENNMLKSLNCCSEGLTWNFWVVLKTFAMKYRHLKQWHSIYMGNDACGDVVVTAKSIAKYLLQSYLRLNTEDVANIDQNVTEEDNSDHVGLCRSLLHEERKILQTSLNNLDHNFFK